MFKIDRERDPTFLMLVAPHTSLRIKIRTFSTALMALRTSLRSHFMLMFPPLLLILILKSRLRLSPITASPSWRTCALIYLCISKPVSESWRTLTLFISVLISKVPDGWQRSFNILLRDIQLTVVQNQLWLHHRMSLCKWDLEGSESHLCFITMLRSLTQEEDLPARHNLCHLQRSMEDCTCPSLTLKTRTWWCVCLLSLKIPLSPSFEEKVFRAGTLPSLFFDQWAKFLLCYAKPSLIQLSAFVIPGKGPIEGPLTHRKLVAHSIPVCLPLNRPKRGCGRDRRHYQRTRQGLEYMMS